MTQQTQRSTRKRPDPRTGRPPASFIWDSLTNPEFHSQEEYEQHIVDYAQVASNLLGDPGFNAVYKEILDENLIRLVESKPAQVELREDSYYRVRGLQDIVLKLNGWKNRYEEMKASKQRGVVEP